MPMFMDTHDGTDLPDNVRRIVEERVRSGKKDDHGVIDRGVVIDEDAKKMHCILDAPDVDAVMRHHKDLNVPLEEHTVHSARGILK